MSSAIAASWLSRAIPISCSLVTPRRLYVPVARSIKPSIVFALSALPIAEKREAVSDVPVGIAKSDKSNIPTARRSGSEFNSSSKPLRMVAYSLSRRASEASKTCTLFNNSAW